MNATLLRAAQDNSAAPMVLLHGMLGAPEAWRAVVTELVYPGAVWALPLPGHGRPALPVADGFEANVRALAARITQPSHVVGYSMGGRLALGLATFTPDMLLTLTAVSAHTGLDVTARNERMLWERAQLDVLLRRGLVEFVDQFEALPIFASQTRLNMETLSAQRAQRLGHDALNIARALVELGSGEMPELAARLAVGRVPLHFVAGGLDKKYVAHANAAARRIPAARVHLIPDAGHNLTLETPKQLARILARAHHPSLTRGEQTHDRAPV